MSNTGTVTNVSTIIADSGSNTLSASAEFVNDGLIEVINSATETVSAPLISGIGTIQIGTGGHLFLNAGTVLAGTIEVGQTIDFTDATGLLTIENNIVGGFDAIINGFQVGDTITVHTTSAATFSLSGSVVLVNSGVITEGALTFANAAQATLAVTTSGALVDLACFAAGTRIRTTRGEVRVEELRVGDMAITGIDGSEAPIVWIGQRTVDCNRHPQPKSVWPVRLKPGALGEGMPKHTLTLSPDHAVYVNKVLIPVKHLINGSTIAQVKVDRLTYYHVELPRHDVLLAEGMPVESYLDIGGRTNFANGGPVVRMQTEFGHHWECMGCAPLVVWGEELAAAKAVVARQALDYARRAPTGTRSFAR